MGSLFYISNETKESCPELFDFIRRNYPDININQIEQLGISNSKNIKILLKNGDEKVIFQRHIPPKVYELINLFIDNKCEKTEDNISQLINFKNRFKQEKKQILDLIREYFDEIKFCNFNFRFSNTKNEFNSKFKIDYNFAGVRTIGYSYTQLLDKYPELIDFNKQEIANILALEIEKTIIENVELYNSSCGTDKKQELQDQIIKEIRKALRKANKYNDLHFDRDEVSFYFEYNRCSTSKSLIEFIDIPEINLVVHEAKYGIKKYDSVNKLDVPEIVKNNVEAILKKLENQRFYFNYERTKYVYPIEFATKKYRKVVPSLFCGFKEMALVKTYMKINDKQNIYIEPFDVVFNFEENTYKWGNKYDVYCYNKDKMDKIIDFWNSEISKNNLIVSFSSGSGLFFGKTKMIFKDIITNYELMLEKPAVNFSNFNSCKKQLKEIIQEAREIIDTEEMKIRKEKIEKYLEFAGSFLVRDAVKLIVENEQCITVYASSQALRGLKIQLNAKVTLTDNCGKYNWISGVEVQETINKMIKAGILEQEYINGKHYDYYLVKPKDKDWIIPKLNIDFKAINKKLSENNKISDDEAEVFFNKYSKKKNIVISDYLKILKLVDCKGFICVYKDEYIAFIKSAPKEFFDFVKIKLESEENYFVKKVYREILKK